MCVRSHFCCQGCSNLSHWAQGRTKLAEHEDIVIVATPWPDFWGSMLSDNSLLPSPTYIPTQSFSSPIIFLDSTDCKIGAHLEEVGKEVIGETEKRNTLFCWFVRKKRIPNSVLGKEKSSNVSILLPKTFSIWARYRRQDSELTEEIWEKSAILTNQALDHILYIRLTWWTGTL